MRYTRREKMTGKWNGTAKSHYNRDKKKKNVFIYKNVNFGEKFAQLHLRLLQKEKKGDPDGSPFCVADVFQRKTFQGLIN